MSGFLEISKRYAISKEPIIIPLEGGELLKFATFEDYGHLTEVKNKCAEFAKFCRSKRKEAKTRYGENVPNEHSAAAACKFLDELCLGWSDVPEKDKEPNWQPKPDIRDWFVWAKENPLLIENIFLQLANKSSKDAFENEEQAIEESKNESSPTDI